MCIDNTPGWIKLVIALSVPIIIIIINILLAKFAPFYKKNKYKIAIIIISIIIALMWISSQMTRSSLQCL